MHTGRAAQKLRNAPDETFLHMHFSRNLTVCTELYNLT